MDNEVLSMCLSVMCVLLRIIAIENSFPFRLDVTHGEVNVILLMLVSRLLYNVTISIRL